LKPAICVQFFRFFAVVAIVVGLPGWSLHTGRASVAQPAEVGAAVAEAAEPTIVARPTVTATVPTKAVVRAERAFRASDWAPSAVGSIDPQVFEMALGAATCALNSGAVDHPRTLTIIDYSKPSTAKRFWVYDLASRQLLYEELVAHGQGSGANFATQFSNEDETHRSSLGLFVTDDTYVGRNGYSLRLNGLDAGFNDRARARAIVMHGAPYVNQDFIAAQGRLGRSWGCPALREGVAREVIDRVKGGDLVFAYYPDANWLKSSKYLGGCAAAN
jgi:L,D-transpeptidase catalytic domain